MYHAGKHLSRAEVWFGHKKPVPASGTGFHTTDKPRKRKNPSEKKKNGRNFFLLRQLRLQIAVTYVRVSSLICSLVSLPCRLFKSLAKR